MRWATAKADRVLEESQQGILDDAVRQAGGTSRWHTSRRADRSYVLMQFEHGSGIPAEVVAAIAASGLTPYDAPVIAIAVFPSVAEALPLLIGALGGDGRPAGIRSCEPCGGGGVAIEWDLDVTPASTVLMVTDVELARLHSGRTAELLSPLPEPWVARIAAGGVRTPDISPDRTLETLLQRAGLHA